MSEGFEHVGFEESVWVRPKGGKYGEDIYVSTHVDDCLICCKSTATMSKFKQELLTRIAHFRNVGLQSCTYPS